MALLSSADHSFHSARPLIYTQRAVRAIAHSTRLDARKCSANAGAAQRARQQRRKHRRQAEDGAGTWVY